jgi:hypothetical protein
VLTNGTCGSIACKWDAVHADLNIGAERNPWVDLPHERPYVLPADIAAFPELCGPQSGLRCNLLPVPLMGDPRMAAIVILSINPKAGEEMLGQDTAFDRELRLSLTFQNQVSFYPLDRRFMSHSGQTYWAPRLRDLLAVFQTEVLASAIACVEWFPYQSQRFRQLPRGVRLDSQRYGFWLVRQAIHNKALFVGPPSLRRWEEDVSTLGQAEVVRFRSPRCTYLSRRNLGPENFDRVCQRIAAFRPAP